jgi:hypothetical protein
MEQLVARRAHNPKVAGSSPAPATNKRNPAIAGFFIANVSFSLSLHINKNDQVAA